MSDYNDISRKDFVMNLEYKLYKGLPFKFEFPLDISTLTNEELYYELTKEDNGVVYSLEDFKAELNRLYGI